MVNISIIFVVVELKVVKQGKLMLAVTPSSSVRDVDLHHSPHSCVYRPQYLFFLKPLRNPHNCWDRIFCNSWSKSLLL